MRRRARFSADSTGTWEMCAHPRRRSCRGFRKAAEPAVRPSVAFRHLWQDWSVTEIGRVGRLVVCPKRRRARRPRPTAGKSPLRQRLAVRNHRQSADAPPNDQGNPLPGSSSSCGKAETEYRVQPAARRVAPICRPLNRWEIPLGPRPQRHAHGVFPSDSATDRFWALRASGHRHDRPNPQLSESNCEI